MATIQEVTARLPRVMRQVLYEPRTGEVRLDEVPAPLLEPGGVLVRNAFSVVSPGTERNKLSFGEKSLLAKARTRPDLVRQVFQAARREGIAATYAKVFSRLNMPETLGYCSAGVVEEVSEGVSEFQVGDRVACAGASAGHSEINFVPMNLCVQVPQNLSLEQAAFGTLGAIALQGVRQAELRFGESVCVIGLGIVGILVAQLVKASGCRVYAIDIDPGRVDIAKSVGIESAFASNEVDVLRELTSLTEGRGMDAVIVAAHSSSSEPVKLAADLARDKGRIVVVGAVPMDLPRQPFYEKELDLRLSRSYGPGRYDEVYEKYGVDYPYAYVRWTERRNIRAFLEAVGQGQVSVSPLISHRMPLGDAQQAYELIKNDRSVVSVLFEYTQESPHNLPRQSPIISKRNGGSHISVIGAGNFAQAYRVPYLKRYADSLVTIVTRQGHHATHLRQKWSFAAASTNPEDAFHDPQTTGVLIATRHDSHANLASQAFEAGKPVFLEKPIAMTEEDLRLLWHKYQQFNGRLMVGFNRRFAQASQAAKKFLGAGPFLMHYRINNTVLPLSHWTADPQQGGGRVIGELCHFVDLFCFFASAVPVTVSAEALPGTDEQLSATIRLSDGSIGTITHSVNGDINVGKERLEVYGSSRVAIINNFEEVYLGSGRKSSTRRTRGKGHEECVATFCKWLSKSSEPPPIDPAELFLGALATLMIPKAISVGARASISL
jgi:predicted dehydrogenase/threonine dehydrogenase-like Zn-dependent dehydrogenase